MKPHLFLVVCLWIAGCASATRDTSDVSRVRFNWDTSTELAKFPRAKAAAGATLDIKPVIHEMPPPYGPYGGINFSGVVMFDLVIDADGNVLAALPKAVDGMCSCKLESLVEHRIKPLGAALLRWKFSAQKPIQRDELVVLEMPIDFQKAQDRQ